MSEGKKGSTGHKEESVKTDVRSICLTAYSGLWLVLGLLTTEPAVLKPGRTELPTLSVKH